MEGWPGPWGPQTQSLCHFLPALAGGYFRPAGNAAELRAPGRPLSAHSCSSPMPWHCPLSGNHLTAGLPSIPGFAGWPSTGPGPSLTPHGPFSPSSRPGTPSTIRRASTIRRGERANQLRFPFQAEASPPSEVNLHGNNLHQGPEWGDVLQGRDKGSEHSAESLLPGEKAPARSLCPSRMAGGTMAPTPGPTSSFREFSRTQDRLHGKAMPPCPTARDPPRSMLPPWTLRNQSYRPDGPEVLCPAVRSPLPALSTLSLHPGLHGRRHVWHRPRLSPGPFCPSSHSRLLLT